MRTADKFASLDSKSREEVTKLLELERGLGNDDADLWERVVNYVYERDNQVQADWFIWWE